MLVGLPLFFVKLGICDDTQIGLLSLSVTFREPANPPNSGSFIYGLVTSGRDYSCLDMGFVLCFVRFPHIVM